MSVWTEYEIEGKFVDEVRGGLPADPKLVEVFLAGKGLDAENMEDAQRILDVAQKRMTMGGVEESMMNIFPQDDEGLFLRGYQIHGALKEAMSIQKSITSWRQKLARGVRVIPDRIYLTRNGEKVNEVDGVDTSVVHSEHMGRPVSSLRKVELLRKVEFSCKILVANEKGKPIISEDKLRNLLEHIEYSGIGAQRSMGYGRCELQLK